MRSSLILGLLPILFFAGCIQQEFYHRFDAQGNSTLTAQYNFSQFIAMAQQQGAAYGMPGGFTEEEFEQEMRDACAARQQQNPALTCETNGGRVTMSVPLATVNSYYTWNVDEGFLYRTYTLTMNKIASDQFRLDSSNLPPGAETDSSETIDLYDKETNARDAAGYRSINGFVFTYTVEMPGTITTATAGNYSAEINGNVALFDMVDVLEDSEPLVVQSQELNILPAMATGALGLLILLSIVFFFTKR